MKVIIFGLILAFIFSVGLGSAYSQPELDNIETLEIYIEKQSKKINTFQRMIDRLQSLIDLVQSRIDEKLVLINELKNKDGKPSVKDSTEKTSSVIIDVSDSFATLDSDLENEKRIGYALDFTDKEEFILELGRIGSYYNHYEFCEDGGGYYADKIAFHYPRSIGNYTGGFGNLDVNVELYQKDLDGNKISWVSSSDVRWFTRGGEYHYNDHTHLDFASCGVSVNKVEVFSCIYSDLFEKSKSGYDGIGCVIPEEYWTVKCQDIGNDCEFVRYDKP